MPFRTGLFSVESEGYHIASSSANPQAFFKQIKYLEPDNIIRHTPSSLTSNVNGSIVDVPT